MQAFTRTGQYLMVTAPRPSGKAFHSPPGWSVQDTVSRISGAEINGSEAGFDLFELAVHLGFEFLRLRNLELAGRENVERVAAEPQ